VEGSEEVLSTSIVNNSNFGRFSGFIGENKFHFLRVTVLLLFLNIATRLAIAPSEAHSSKK
jgi:hypothetical protein